MFELINNKIRQVQAQDELEKPRKRPFLQHIHYFRGFAIINIVMIHLLFPYLNEHIALFKIPDIIVDLLFADSTLYFVLISGFLFAYLAHRVEVKSYYQVKFKNVVLPYIFITFLVSFFKYRDLLMSMQWGTLLEKFFSHLVRGDALVPFWYIPFIAVVFLISPFFLMLSEQQFRKVTFFAVFLPLLGSRPVIELTPWHFMYYIPVYMMGMFIARNYEQVLECVLKYRTYLFTAIILSSLVLVYILWLPDDSFLIQKNIQHSLFYIQRISISLLLLRYLRKFDNKKINWLDYLAVYSFSIYFLHPLVQYVIVEKLLYLKPLHPYINMAPVLYIILVAVLILFLTLLTAIVLSRLLGRYSRMFIGA